MAEYPRTDGTLTVLGPPEAVHEDLYVVGGLFRSAPGLSFPTRMMLAKLPDGTLLVYSPFNPDLVDLSGFAAVSKIIAPSAAHSVYAQAFLERFPQATLYSSPALAARFPEREWGRVLRKDVDENEIEGVKVGVIEAFMFKEVVVVHQASRSLLLADMGFNYSPRMLKETPWGAWMFVKVFRGTGVLDWSCTLKMLCRGGCKEGVKELDGVLKWEWDRVVPCHGEIVGGGGKVAFRGGVYKFAKDVAEGREGGWGVAAAFVVVILAVVLGWRVSRER